MPHPDIISESGRAIVAHHSVLIVEVFGAIEKIRAGDALPIRRKRARRWSSELLDIRKNLPSSTSWRPTTTRWSARKTPSTCSPWACWTCRTRPRSRTSTGRSAARSSQSFKGQALRARGNPQARRQPRRPVPLQLLRLPVPAGSLGARPVVPHHARQPPQRAPHARGHAGGHHLRFRRPGQQVH